MSKPTTEEMVHHFEEFASCFFHDEKTGELKSLCPVCCDIRRLIIAVGEWIELAEKFHQDPTGISLTRFIDSVRGFRKDKK